jgi:hypothetical protein
MARHLALFLCFLVLSSGCVHSRRERDVAASLVLIAQDLRQRGDDAAADRVLREARRLGAAGPRPAADAPPSLNASATFVVAVVVTAVTP